MLVLAIDTSSEVAGLALGRDDVLISELHFRHSMDLLRRLLPNIRWLLSDAGFSAGDLDGVVVSLGPGSFTGLRIGIAAAKTLAYALKKPIVGIPTLDVIASGLLPAQRPICPMLHARPGEVYMAFYRIEDGKIKKEIREISAQVADIARQLRVLNARHVVFAGSGARINWELLKDLGTLASADFDLPRASILLKMGIERLLRGEQDEAFGLVPLYVRRPTPEIRLESR